MKRFFMIALILVAFRLNAQDTLKIMTYNIHQYTPYNPTENDPSRLDWDNPALKFVVNAVNPDILVCQEVVDKASVEQFLKYVLEYKYKAADFIASTGMNSALFYKEDKIESLGNIIHDAVTRPIHEFPVVNKITGDTLIIFSVHLKANTRDGDNSENLNKRFEQAKVLRSVTSKFAEDKDYIVLGDFNTLNGSEAAVAELIDTSAPGYFIDPLDAIGEWNYNPLFKHVHSYSSAELTNRFDMILISQAVKDPGGIEYISNSYTIVGNDGNHFKMPVNFGTNTFGIELADSLVSASDHLPVYALFKFDKLQSVSNDGEMYYGFELYQNYPNPFNPSTNIKFKLETSGYVKLVVFDILGREITQLVNGYYPPGSYEFSFDSSSYKLSSGIYFYTLNFNGYSTTQRMILIK
ncbi:T9SS type A sorting domain-containing protein [Melioribacter sp. OK-6-Me]|uniref:T9SS type A sorting domain-containing protein n=1 Tax=unclassified Melioribacter TaxID=2627329 RepID=UPI003EDA2B29